jgi:hypothetical protein
LRISPHKGKGKETEACLYAKPVVNFLEFFPRHVADEIPGTDRVLDSTWGTRLNAINIFELVRRVTKDMINK